MSSRGLNLCTLAGNVAADPTIRQINRKSGGSTQLCDFRLYVSRIPSRQDDDSFSVKVTIWEGSAAWRKLNYIRKGSLIIATGSIDASPYIRKTDNQPQAGLTLKAVDVFLDTSPRDSSSQPMDPSSSVEPAVAF